VSTADRPCASGRPFAVGDSRGGKSYPKLSEMNAITRRLISKTMEQVAGSGVGIDADGRLCFPDGLDPEHVHRFIELVMDDEFASPKAAMEALFERVGVPKPAIDSLGEVLTTEGSLHLSAIGRHPIRLAASLPSVRQIPEAFRRFLVDGLGFASETDQTLQEAVISTRVGAARALGCKASWDAILGEGARVSEFGKGWREKTAASE
jgi:hypothetical protein